MWFFWDLFKWPAYVYATVFKELCINSWIGISEYTIISDDMCAKLILKITSWESWIPLHTRNAILGYLKSNNPKYDNPKNTAICIYLYSIELYWGSVKLEEDKQTFSDIFWY